MYKVGDRVRVTNLRQPRDWEVKVGDVFQVAIVDRDGDVYVSGDNARLLVQSEVEKVEEEVKVKEFKVGDKVKVLVQGSFGSEAEKGRIYTIETVDYDDRSLELEELPAFDQWVYMSDVEIVSGSSYKVGDKVKLISGGGSYPLSDFSNNKEYTILELNHFHEKGRLIQLKNIEGVSGASVGYARVDQLELVNQTSFTFPEMVQKLIDGEFEVGTELVMTDEDGLKGTFYVRKNMYGYGISKEADWFVENKATFPSVLNGIWTVKEEVKEEPIKEMSIEELQKELGYKIKITE